MRFVFAHYRFGTDLRRWRKFEGLTQGDVGELFDVSAGAISGWERGKNPGMLMQNFINACEWMDVDPREYFDDWSHSPGGDIPF